MHQFVEFNLRLLPKLVHRGVFNQEPFTLIDVGCSLRLHPIWRRFGDCLRVFGFDLWIEEINRLTRKEPHPNVRYYAARIALPSNHPFKLKQAEEQPRYVPDNALKRAGHRALRERNEKYRSRPKWRDQELSQEVVFLSDFVKEKNNPYVDFIKIDTDGADLEVLISCEKLIEDCSVLGFVVEAHYFGSFYATENTFSNVDRFMRRQGFKLFNFSQARCACAALPMPFVSRFPGQTVSGQVMWGDFLYLRDPVDTEFSRHWSFTPTPRQLLKLICLYEIFGLPDCAAELAVERRDDIANLVDVDWVLDTLTPPINGASLSYEDYVRKFYTEPEAFFPEADGT